MSNIRILVVSDSHGDIEIIKELYEMHSDFDYFIHLGDHVSDIEKAGLADKFICVKGNTDFGSDELEDKYIKIGSKRLFLTHGHKYDVKHSLNRLYYSAMEMKSDIILFGHTHVAINLNYEEILIFNPGSVSRPRNSKKGTFGIVEISMLGEVQSEIMEKL